MINNKNSVIGSLPEVVDRGESIVQDRVTGETASTYNEQVQVENPAASYEKIYYGLRKVIRTTSWWLVAWTVFSVIDNNIPWAMALAVVTLMSFYFYDVAALFLVYAGVMAWAAVWNILVSGDPIWIIMGVIQVAFTVAAVKQYRKYKNVKAEYEAALVKQDLHSSMNKRESKLAWAALMTGGIVLVGLIGFIPAIFLAYFVNSVAFEDLVSAVLVAIMELGVLGIPVGIAAVITGSRPKAAAIAGIVFGAISMLIEIIFAVLGSMQ